MILDWKGLAELAMRSGLIAKLHADIVCENDVFDYNLGEIVQHKIDFAKPRGAMYAAYAMAVTKDGPVFVAVLNKDEIDAIRRRSKSGSSGPWQTDYNEMAKKTAFRRLAKWLPLSAEFRDAIDKDDDVVVPERDVTPKAARAQPLDPFTTMPEAPAPGQTPLEHTDDVPVVEAEVVEPAPEDHMDDPALLDFLDQIQGCEDGAALTQLVKPANDGFEGAKQEIAKRAIANKAKELGVKWNKAKGGFEQP